MLKQIMLLLILFFTWQLKQAVALRIADRETDRMYGEDIEQTQSAVFLTHLQPTIAAIVQLLLASDVSVQGKPTQKELLFAPLTKRS
jgi:hypothetical protein